MPKVVETALGRMIFTDEVIATIAGVAATECYGIVGMTPRKLADGIAELLGLDSITSGVVIGGTNDVVNIDLYVIAGYGTRLSEVAQNVVDNVKYSVESMTGLVVGSVVVHIQGVRVGHH